MWFTFIHKMHKTFYAHISSMPFDVMDWQFDVIDWQSVPFTFFHRDDFHLSDQFLNIDDMLHVGESGFLRSF